MLEGGCSVPVGVETSLVEVCASNSANGDGAEGIATTTNGHRTPHAYPRVCDPHSAKLTLTGTITSLAGTSAVFATLTREVHSIEEAEQLGADIAQELIASGGKQILTELGRHVKEVGGEEGKEVPFESNNAKPHPHQSQVNLPPQSAKARAEYLNEMQTVEPEAEALHHPLGVFKGDKCERPLGW